MATLSFIIDAQNRAGQAIKEVESQVKGLEGKVKDMQPVFQKMALVGTAAFAGIAAASWKAIEAYGVQERYEIKLAHLLKQTTDATDEQVQALYDQASALQQVGVYGDEVTLSLMGQLATFELNSETIATMTPAILDMIAAEKGLNATTEDMISFGNAFGTAMEGKYAALTHRGFNLDAETMRIIENGTETEKAAAIIAYLTGTYGGLNEAMRETSQGGLQAMKNELGDLWESIGQALIPIIKDLTETLLPVLQKTVEWAKENPQLVKTIIIASGAIAGIIAVIGTLGLMLPPIIAGFKLLGVAIGILTSPISLIIAAIALLVAGIVYLWNTNETFRNTIIAIWEGIKSYIEGWIASVIAGFKFLVDGVKMYINWWVKNVALLWEWLEKAFNGSVDFMKKGIEDLVAFLEFLAQGWIVLFDLIIKISSDLAQWIIKTWKVIMDKTEEIWTGVANFFSGFWNNLKSTTKAAVDWLMGVIQPFINAFETVKSGASWIASQAGGVLSGAGNFIGGLMGGGQFGIDNVPRTGMYMLHRGEQVVPAGSGTGGGITVNINGGYYLSEQIAEDLGDKIIDQLKRQMKI